MPRKNKHTAKHPQYQKPDYHAQNASQNDSTLNGTTNTKKKQKKTKPRTSYDVYQRLLYDKNLCIDLDDVYIGYHGHDKVEDSNTKIHEIPILHWTDVNQMQQIQYFALRSHREGTKTIIWDKNKRIDLLFDSRNGASLKTLLATKQQTDEKEEERKYVQTILTSTYAPLSMLDSLISVFSKDTHREWTNSNESSKMNSNQIDSSVTATNKRIGIMFMGGSYNPVHAQHIELMCVIKKYFEEKHNIDVIAGYLVITTDKYVYSKLQHEAISFEHRKKLCELSCAGRNAAELSWLHPSEYECSSAIQYLQREFLPKYPQALMINCMGADKILKNTKKGSNKGSGKWIRYSQSFKNRKCLTVCINRRGYADHAYNLYLQDKQDGKVNPNAFMFVNVNVDAVSSTMIRNVLQQYQKEREVEQKQETEDENENERRAMLLKYAQELRPYMNEQCVQYLLANVDHLWYRPSNEKKKSRGRKRKTMPAPWDD